MRSLRALTLAFIAAFLLVTAGAGVAIFAANQRTIARLVDARIVAVADGVVAGGDRATPELLRRIAALHRERDTGDLGAMLVDRNGRRLGGNVALRRPPVLGLSTLDRDSGVAGLSAGRAFARAAGGGRVLAIVGETEPFDDYARVRSRIYLVGFGAIVVVVLAGLLLFARLIGRRIGAMRTTVDAIVDGDMRRRIPLAGDGGAFDAQAAGFNRMLDRVADLMRGIADVSSAIAHDLRSPLARLRGQLALLERQADAPLREGLTAAVSQTDAVLAIFAAMLRIAEVEGGERRAGFVAIDAGALVAEVAAMMAPVAEDGGYRLTASATALPIQGDRQLLIQMLVNLVENALRHTPPGTRIHLDAQAAAGMARIAIADDGPGIAPADRARALARFGRLDESRSGAGHGLGLPLVAAIVRLHRGDIVLDDAAPGLCVRLTLPLS